MNLSTQWLARFFLLTHICRRVTALCTIHTFFKLSLISSTETCAFQSVICVLLILKKTLQGQIQHVCFVIIMYMLRRVEFFSRVLSTMATIAVVQVFPPPCLPKSIKSLMATLYITETEMASTSYSIMCMNNSKALGDWQ